MSTLAAPAFQAEVSNGCWCQLRSVVLISISQCSPRHLRGMISSTFQLACTLGIFLSNVVNYNSRWYHGVRLVSLLGESYSALLIP